MQNFCNPLHGDAIQIVHHVFVHILPHLTLDPNEKDLNNKNLLALKDTSFMLVKSFITKSGAVIYPLLQGVIKHICVVVVDRSEYRQKTAQTALDLLQLIPNEHQQGNRQLFGINARPQKILWVSQELSGGFCYLRTQSRPIYVFFPRRFCQFCYKTDELICLSLPSSLPSVPIHLQPSGRSKALSILGECIESNDHSMVDMLDTMFTEDVVMQVTNDKEDEEIDIIELLQAEEPIDISSTFLPKASEIVSLLQERCLDEKVHVRKNALQLLLLVARRHERYLTQDLLKLLGNACRDVAMLIRRNIAQVLTELLSEHPDNEAVRKMWAQSVLPLVLDGETRVQEKAVECADQLVLQSLLSNESQQG